MHESITNPQTETKPKKTAQISLLLVVVERDQNLGTTDEPFGAYN